MKSLPVAACAAATPRVADLGAVFERTAEVALAGVRGKQLAVQVTVAALDVHAVEACLLRKRSRRAKLVDEAVQVIVRQDALRRNRLITLKNRIIVRNKRRRDAFRLGVAAGMGSPA